jgi:hypothetical protein
MNSSSSTRYAAAIRAALFASAGIDTLKSFQVRKIRSPYPAQWSALLTDAMG